MMKIIRYENNDRTVEGSKIMFRRILVPLDGSELAERALLVAARLARACGGAIALLRVVPSPFEFTSQAAELAASTREAFYAEQARAADYLARITASALVAGVTTTAEVFRGRPAEVILSVARSQQIDIIVMCSHGYTGMIRWVLGSVAAKVAFHAPVPVLVLREGGPVPAGPHPDATRPLRALVALDGSARAEEGIEPAASLIAGLAAPAQGALHLAQVVKPANGDDGERDSDANKVILYKAREYLSSTVNQLHEAGMVSTAADLELPLLSSCPSAASLANAVGETQRCRVSWSVAVDADVASALIRVAENGEDAEGAGVFGGCDIIAMTTHGYGGVQRWAMGSITDRVLRACKLPLLIVRPLDIMEKSNLTWDKATLSAI
jgi:nucleotide-binding universal stress UspA family protein